MLLDRLYFFSTDVVKIRMICFSSGFSLNRISNFRQNIQFPAYFNRIVQTVTIEILRYIQRIVCISFGLVYDDDLDLLREIIDVCKAYLWGLKSLRGHTFYVETL